MNRQELSKAANDPAFLEVVNMIIEQAVDDPELQAGIDHIWEQAEETGHKFQEQVYLTILKHQSEQRAREWRERLSDK